MSLAGTVDCSQQTLINQPHANNLDIGGLDILGVLHLFADLYTLFYARDVQCLGFYLQRAVHRNGLRNMQQSPPKLQDFVLNQTLNLAFEINFSPGEASFQQLAMTPKSGSMTPGSGARLISGQLHRASKQCWEFDFLTLRQSSLCHSCHGARIRPIHP